MNNSASRLASTGFVPWDNPRDILSYRDYLLTLFVLNNLIQPVVVVVGVPSNIISCVVFWRQGLGDRMNVCLLALSLVDLCDLLVSVVYCVGYYLGQVDPVTYGGLFDLLLTYVSGVNLGFRSASGCITMVISVERCLCVIFPLKAATLISRRTMAVIMICIVCFTQVAFFTTPAEFTLVSVYNSSSKFIIAMSEFYNNNQMLFSFFESLLMMSVLPLTTFLVTCVSTGLTVVKLRAAMTWRGQVSSSSERGQGQHTALTKMLVLVSCIYILTSIPWVVFYLATFVVEDLSSQGTYYTYYNFFWTSALTANQFSYVNSSLSFYVYFNRSTRFRKDVSILLCSSCTFTRRDTGNKVFEKPRAFLLGLNLVVSDLANIVELNVVAMTTKNSAPNPTQTELEVQSEEKVPVIWKPFVC